jgi:hypothetical protein
VAGERIDYNVNAWLRARGNFSKQMARNAASVRPLHSRMVAMGRTTETWGRMVMGTTAATAASWTKTAGVVGGLVAAGGLAMLVKQGMDFNNQMEAGQLSIASMYQLYGQNQRNFQANLAQSKGAMRELFDMAKKSPVEFTEAVDIYQGAASGLIVANQSMREQMEFMKGAQMLKGVIPDLDAKTIGAQLGRTMMGGAGAEFEVWKRLAPAILENGKAMGTFNDSVMLGQKFTQEFNKIAQAQPEVAMDLLKKSVKPLEDLADEYERSWGGIISTTKSNMRIISGSFAKPLNEATKNMLFQLNKTGFMSNENIGKLEHIGMTMGIMLAGAGEKLFLQIVAGAEFLRDNWQDVFQTIRNTGQVVAMAIKGAFFVGVARMLIGAGMVGSGKLMRAGGAARGGAGMMAEMFGRMQKRQHFRMGRGLRGKGGGGIAGMLGAGAGRLLGTSSKGAGPFGKMFKFMDTFTLKVGSFGMVLAGGIPIIIGLALAFGTVITVVAGLSAYVIQNWQAISGAIVQGLTDGRITLVPLLTALYTFWARLVIVGEAFLGGSDHVGQFNGMLNLMIGMIEIASGAIAVFMKALAISIGIWGALKLTLLGVMKVILEMLRLNNKVGLASDESLANAERNYAKFKSGTVDTFTTVDQLLSKADQIKNFQFDKADLAKVEKQAKAWEDKLKKALSGDPKKKLPRAPKVAINKVEIVMDLRDSDPDRLMAAFVEPLERMADKRVQAYDQLEQGT